MHIKGLATGPIQENCYLVYNDDTLLIIDPGEDAPQIINNESEGDLEFYNYLKTK